MRIRLNQQIRSYNDYANFRVQDINSLENMGWSLGEKNDRHE